MLFRSAKFGKAAINVNNINGDVSFEAGVDFGTSTVSVSAGSTVVLTVGQAEALSANGTIAGAAAGGGEPAANVYVNTGDVLSRSEEHTSELQSQSTISYAVFWQIKS